MINKKTIITFSLIFLMVIVVAQVLTLRNLDADLSLDNVTKLAEYDITTPNATALICNEVVCSYRMYQVLPNGDWYNLGTHELDRGNKSRAELESEQEAQIVSWLEDYANTLEKRERSAITEIISNSTQINIQEKR